MGAASQRNTCSASTKKGLHKCAALFANAVDPQKLRNDKWPHVGGTCAAVSGSSNDSARLQRRYLVANVHDLHTSLCGVFLTGIHTCSSVASSVLQGFSNIVPEREPRLSTSVAWPLRLRIIRWAAWRSSTSGCLAQLRAQHCCSSGLAPHQCPPVSNVWPWVRGLHMAPCQSQDLPVLSPH